MHSTAWSNCNCLHLKFKKIMDLEWVSNDSETTPELPSRSELSNRVVVWNNWIDNILCRLILKIQSIFGSPVHIHCHSLSGFNPLFKFSSTRDHVFLIFPISLFRLSAFCSCCIFWDFVWRPLNLVSNPPRLVMSNRTIRTKYNHELFFFQYILTVRRSSRYIIFLNYVLNIKLQKKHVPTADNCMAEK